MQKVMVGTQFSNPPNFNSYKFERSRSCPIQVYIKKKNKSNLHLMVKHVHVNADEIHRNQNGRINFAFFKTDKFGDVFAKSFDCGRTFDTWKPGGIVFLRRSSTKNCMRESGEHIVLIKLEI